MSGNPPSPPSPPPALRGITVLDFSHVIAGPFATFHLARLGADVIKVERPGGSDAMRHTASGQRGYTVLNAGKQERAIDLTTSAGRAEALQLARQADVIVDNYRPGALARHGLGYDAVRAINPRVIYCSISGYGLSQPALSTRGAYDHVIQALTGMTMLAGLDGDPPIKTGFPVIDAATGLLGALAVVTAVLERERTGAGCHLDVSMWSSALQLMYTFACDAMSTQQEIPRVGNRGYSGSPASEIFTCRDGWLAVGANTTRQVQRLMQVLAIEPSTYEPLLEPNTAGEDSFAKARDREGFHALLAARLADRSAFDLELRLNDVGVPAARVRSLREFTGEALASGLLQPLQLPGSDGPALSPGLGWRLVDHA